MGAGAGAAHSYWFNSVFGFSETLQEGTSGYAKTKGQFTYDAATGIMTTRPGSDAAGVPKKSRTFSAGKFETPSLEDLRRRADLEAASKSLGDRRLVIREVIADASELHTLAENKHATFQAASQFNTLEHCNPRGRPEDGITCYAGDKTQGPACATTCAPGTIVRNYFAFGGKGQTAARQVQNLEDVEAVLDNRGNKYFKVINGYTMSDDADVERLALRLGSAEDRGPDGAELAEQCRSKLKIGVQTDTEVVCSNFGQTMFTDPTQLVTQAYCSAISVSYSGCRSKNWEPFARLVLEALYEATLFVAIENALRHPDAVGSRRVFLTAVGGGVFGNDMAWVHDAIWRAAQSFEQCGLEVFLVSFRVSTPQFRQLEARWEEGLAGGASPGGEQQEDAAEEAKAT